MLNKVQSTKINLCLINNDTEYRVRGTIVMLCCCVALRLRALCAEPCARPSMQKKFRSILEPQFTRESLDQSQFVWTTCGSLVRQLQPKIVPRYCRFLYRFALFFLSISLNHVSGDRSRFIR